MLLLALWLALAGSFGWQHLAVGLLVVGAVLLANHDLLFRPGEFRALSPRRVPQLAVYLLLLLRDVVRANLQVARVVLHPRLPCEPCLVIFRTRLRQETTRAVLANSITLTPGTLAADLREDEMVVHALFAAAARQIPGGWAETRLAAMEEVAGG